VGDFNGKPAGSRDWSRGFTVVNMTRRSGTGIRSQALARAADAVARRDAQRLAREKAVQGALADLFQAQAAVDKIHAEAQRAAQPFDEVIRDAVSTLGALGETRVGIAELTGLPLMSVRHYLTASASATDETAEPEAADSAAQPPPTHVPALVAEQAAQHPGRPGRPTAGLPAPHSPPLHPDS
jgi:hypothetical protein